MKPCSKQTFTLQLNNFKFSPNPLQIPLNSIVIIKINEQTQANALHQCPSRIYYPESRCFWLAVEELNLESP